MLLYMCVHFAYFFYDSLTDTGVNMIAPLLEKQPWDIEIWAPKYDNTWAMRIIPGKPNSTTRRATFDTFVVMKRP